MIRIFIENIGLFLLPTALYAAYLVLARRSAPQEQGRGLLADLPLSWLFAAGATIVLLTLATMSSRSGGKPGEAYHPSVIKDGRIVPGQ